MHPFLQKGVPRTMELGHPTYLRPKGTGEHSMSEKRRTPEVNQGGAPQDPPGMAKAKLLEVQSRLAHSLAHRDVDSKRCPNVRSNCLKWTASPREGIPGNRTWA